MKKNSSQKILVPKGFSLSGIHCGIKKSGKRDLGLIYSKSPGIACGMFTSNKVQAESLKVCQENLRSGVSRAIIVNSGNANCFTGERGIRDTKSIVKLLAKQLGVANKSVLIASTGIIGKPLPVDKIKQGVAKLCQGLGKGKARDFAQAILTTDTFDKCASLKINIKGKPVIITGFAKGAGMIYPDLKHATMLAFILTDASIKKNLLKTALAAAVEKSFNSISVDRCMSTNDTVLVLANAAAGNVSIAKKDKDFRLFSFSLSSVCHQLALMIIRDAEGATKIIEVSVKGAKDSRQAKLAADAVANSDLFKTAMFGNNPNWGRIVAAIGAAGVAIDQSKLEITYNKYKIYKQGKTYSTQKNFLKGKNMVSVKINLNNGKFNKTVYTSDLTPKYVKINAEYN